MQSYACDYRNKKSIMGQRKAKQTQVILDDWHDATEKS